LGYLNVKEKLEQVYNGNTNNNSTRVSYY
jgi:hypothetical protein